MTSTNPLSNTNDVGELSTVILDKDSFSLFGCSPAPSNSSLVSEQEPNDIGTTSSRQSPFLSISQASPSSSCGNGFQRPDFLNIPQSIPDSETSSKSSLDGISLSRETASNLKDKMRMRQSRKESSGSSDSDDSDNAAHGSADGSESGSRKTSKSKLMNDTVIPPNAAPARPKDAPRGRIANIRRESNCSIESEVAHERLMKVSQQVSSTFDDISLETCTQPTEYRKRAPSTTSIGDPISIVTNVFMNHSCSPSPTRLPESHKQCYSPSTQQIVRPNIPYSPSASPTQSPTRHRLLRSLSPITTRGGLKRRYTSGTNDEGDVGMKRPSFVRNSTSPLVNDRSFPYPNAPPMAQEFAQPSQPSSSSSSLESRSHSFSVRRFPTEIGIVRRQSVDSITEDQKSLHDDASESSSLQNILDDSMDVDEATQKDDCTLASASSPTPSEEMCTTSTGIESSVAASPSTSMDAPLPPSEDTGNGVVRFSVEELNEMQEQAMAAPLPDDDDNF